LMAMPASRDLFIAGTNFSFLPKTIGIIEITHYGSRRPIEA
jgi:hypothetical protein